MHRLVVKLFHEALEVSGSSLECTLDDDIPLLDTGLDSLGFAILVARLEEELGYDPFSVMEEAVYPSTLTQFVDIYHQYQLKNAG